MTNFKIDIVSDTVCPWCYVGKRKLDAAIKTYKAAHPQTSDTFSTTWKPFYLNPHAPAVGIDKREFYDSKFGPDRTEMMFARLAQVGNETGIRFKFGGKTGNTRDSHRLILLGLKAKGGGPDVQTRVVEELFSAYFENERDITSREVLVEAGIRAGLDGEEAREWLESGKGGDEVDREVREAMAELVSGVPNYTIQDQFEINGAQDPVAFVHLFERIKRIEESKA